MPKNSWSLSVALTTTRHSTRTLWRTTAIRLPACILSTSLSTWPYRSSARRYRWLEDRYQQRTADIQGLQCSTTRQYLYQGVFRAVAGQQPAPESQPQIALRNMQTKEVEARTGLLSEQTKAAAEQQKWTTLTEEVPTLDPATGLHHHEEAAVPLQSKDQRTSRRNCRLRSYPGRCRQTRYVRGRVRNHRCSSKTMNALTPEQKDALIAQEQTSKAK